MFAGETTIPTKMAMTGDGADVMVLTIRSVLPQFEFFSVQLVNMLVL